MIVDIILGFILLVAGGDTLVKGAVAVARRLGLSELLIGLTLVGIGTSTPEFVTNIEGALAGAPGLAVGNVIGSNLSNILLILGVTAAITPIICPKDLLVRDGFWLILSLLLLSICTLFGHMPRAVGVLFLVLLAVYIYSVYQQEKVVKDASAAMHRHEAEVVRPWVNNLPAGIIISVIGLVLTVFGAKLLVGGSIAVAMQMGVPEVVIGMTIVAVGTSLPELVTAIMASIRKSSDVALGCVVGSNITNILGVLGVTIIVHPLAIPKESVVADIPMLTIVSILLLILVRSGLKLSRREGLGFIIIYCIYITYLALR